MDNKHGPHKRIEFLQAYYTITGAGFLKKGPFDNDNWLVWLRRLRGQKDSPGAIQTILGDMREKEVLETGYDAAVWLRNAFLRMEQAAEGPLPLWTEYVYQETIRAVQRYNYACGCGRLLDEAPLNQLELDQCLHAPI